MEHKVLNCSVCGRAVDVKVEPFTGFDLPYGWVYIEKAEMIVCPDCRLAKGVTLYCGHEGCTKEARYIFNSIEDQIRFEDFWTGKTWFCKEHDIDK